MLGDKKLAARELLGTATKCCLLIVTWSPSIANRSFANCIFVDRLLLILFLLSTLYCLLAVSVNGPPLNNLGSRSFGESYCLSSNSFPFLLVNRRNVLALWSPRI